MNRTNGDAGEQWLEPITTKRVAWHRRLDIRLALVTGALVFVGSLTIPALRHSVRFTLATEGNGADPPSGAAIAVIDGVFFALFLAVVVYVARWLVAKLVSERLEAMTAVLERPIERASELPDTIEGGEIDEISRFASAMNVLHGRVRGLVASVEKRDRERREWLSRISHDLRTPLTALNACLARARTTAEGMEESAERATILDALKVAHLDADRFQALASDLLDVARLEQENAELVCEPVPPGELVRRVAESLKVLAEDIEIDLVVDVPSGLPELYADGHRLARALENLLRNALQHAQHEIVVSVERSGDAVQFAVADDGPGLPTDETGHVDLERLAETPSRPDSSGIGLLVARRVAVLHGGTIGGTNREAGGALVWLRIPRAPRQAPEAELE